MDLIQTYQAKNDDDEEQQQEEEEENPPSSPDSSPPRISLPSKTSAPKVDDTMLALWDRD